MKSCPVGKIRRASYTRKAYTRKDGTRVRKSHIKSGCIRDLGKPGKGKRLFTLKKGGLTKYGYSLKQTKEQRRKTLKKLHRKYGQGTLVKKLNAIRVLMKNTNKQASEMLGRDIKFVQKIL